MKIKRFNEGIVFKKYAHLSDYLKKRFDSDNVIFYEWDDGKIDITLVYFSTVSKLDFEAISEYFKDCEWTLTADQKRHLNIKIPVTEQIMNDLKIELEAEKYNL